MNTWCMELASSIGPGDIVFDNGTERRVVSVGSTLDGGHTIHCDNNWACYVPRDCLVRVKRASPSEAKPGTRMDFKQVLVSTLKVGDVWKDSCGDEHVVDVVTGFSTGGTHVHCSDGSTLYDVPGWEMRVMLVTKPASTTPPEADVGRKDDSGKLRYSLIDPFAIAWLAASLSYGAVKYAPENWRKVDDANNRYYDSLKRHLEAWRTGEHDDPDSGLHHLSGVMFAAMCLTALNAPRDLAEIAKRTVEAIRRELKRKAAAATGIDTASVEVRQ